MFIICIKNYLGFQNQVLNLFHNDDLIKTFLFSKNKSQHEINIKLPILLKDGYNRISLLPKISEIRLPDGRGRSLYISKINFLN